METIISQDWPVLLGAQTTMSDSLTSSAPMINLAVFNAEVISTLSFQWDTYINTFNTHASNKEKDGVAYYNDLKDGQCAHLIMQFLNEGKALESLKKLWSQFATPSRRGGGFLNQRPWSQYPGRRAPSYFSAMTEGQVKTNSMWGSNLPPGTSIGFDLRAMLPWEINVTGTTPDAKFVNAADAWSRGSEYLRLLHDHATKRYMLASADTKPYFWRALTKFADSLKVVCMFIQTTDVIRGSFYKHHVLYHIHSGCSLGRAGDSTTVSWELQFEESKKYLLNPVESEKLHVWDGGDTTEFQAHVTVRSNDLFYYKDQRGGELTVGHRALMLFMGFHCVASGDGGEDDDFGSHEERKFTKAKACCPFVCFYELLATLGKEFIKLLDNRLPINPVTSLNDEEIRRQSLVEIQTRHAFEDSMSILDSKAPNCGNIFSISTTPGKIEMSTLRDIFDGALKTCTKPNSILKEAEKVNTIPLVAETRDTKIKIKAEIKESVKSNSTKIRYLKTLSMFRVLFAVVALEIEAVRVCTDEMFKAILLILVSHREMFDQVANFTSKKIKTKGIDISNNVASNLNLGFETCFGHAAASAEFAKLIAYDSKDKESEKNVNLFWERLFQNRFDALRWLILNDFSEAEKEHRKDILCLLATNYAFYAQLLSCFRGLNIAYGLTIARLAPEDPQINWDIETRGLTNRFEMSGMMRKVRVINTRIAYIRDRGFPLEGRVKGVYEFAFDQHQENSEKSPRDVIVEISENILKTLFRDRKNSIETFPSAWGVHVCALAHASCVSSPGGLLAAYPLPGQAEYYWK